MERNELTQRILELIKEMETVTSESISKELEKRYKMHVSPAVTSYKLNRLWKQREIVRSTVPVQGESQKKRYLYADRGLIEHPLNIDFKVKNCKVQMCKYGDENASIEKSVKSPTTRELIRRVFAEQEKPEPLFPEEIAKILKEKYEHEVHPYTIASALNRMVYKFGELTRSKRGFETGYLYHPDPRVIDEWTQNIPYKGLSADEKCILQLVRERIAITTDDIRREAAKGKHDLPVECATLSYKIKKLKELIPWIRTEQYGSMTIIYDGNANPQTLKEKLDQIKFWLSEEGRRKKAYGHEFEDFGKYLLFDVIHSKEKDWFSTNIEAKERVRGRFGEYDLIIEHTFGPPEFALRETLVFEFKAAGRVKSSDLISWDEKRHSYGFIPKLQKEKSDGIFKGKFVRPILVLAHTIEPGLPYIISKEGVAIIYMTQIKSYLERKNIDPDNILKAIHARYFKPR
jgi:hypothetical protein